jgi:hypothetical protein
LKVTILVDCVHVLEYLWSAAWSFFKEGDPLPSAGCTRRQVDPRRQRRDHRRPNPPQGTRLGLEPKQREGANRCADYVLAKRPHLDYPTAFANGWPIATGVIEGAWRHLVKDRMDITGARWGLDSAEAILLLRASSATKTSSTTGRFTSTKNVAASTHHATPWAPSPQARVTSLQKTRTQTTLIQGRVARDSLSRA